MKWEKFQVKLVQKKENPVSRKIHISQNGTFHEKLCKIPHRTEAMDNIE